MSKFKKWSDLEGQPISFDVNSTTEEAMQATDHPSRIHLTTDGRVVMNGVILGDRNPQRGKWDGRVVINKAVPCYARAGMAYYFGDGCPKFKFTKKQAEALVKKYPADKLCPQEFKGLYTYLAEQDGGYSRIGYGVTFTDIPKVADALEPLVGQDDYEYVCFDALSPKNKTFSPVIVRILKDGDIFEGNKYAVLKPDTTDELGGYTHTTRTIKTTNPDYVIRNGAIHYEGKRPIILGETYQVSNDIGVRFFTYKRKRVRRFINGRYENTKYWYKKKDLCK